MPCLDEELNLSASLINILAGAISIGLFAYLFFALVKAERF
ncbi:MAG: K(+)-transporting ATPase subunit F [Microvirgula sp.]